MDLYSLTCLAATVATVWLRRLLAVRILAVAFLLWVAVQQQVDLQQAQRTLSMQIAATSEELGTQRPDLAADELKRILDRTPGGLVALLCTGVLALVPAGSRRGKPSSEEQPQAPI
jgi:hypothetical protein